MRVLVVHAHPLEDSYSAALRDRAVSSLRSTGHDVRVVRLGEGMRSGPGADELANVEALVLVYPTWWGSQPAPLLDWLQRVVGAAIARTRSDSPLRSVEHLIVITSHGSSHLVNRVQGEPGRHLLMRSVLPLCSRDADFRWIALYKLDRLDRAELEAFVERVGTELGALTTSRASA